MKTLKDYRIAHFDIGPAFSPFFKENKYPFPLNSQNLSAVKDLSKLEIVTLKSTSKVDKAVLTAMSSLRAIISRTVGANHIDLKQCKEHNITVWHIPDYGAFAIGEHVFALLLAQTRKIITTSQMTKKGIFNWEEGQGYTLKNKTLGIIGVGKTGRETAKIAQGFQMKVLGYDIYHDEQFAKSVNLQYVTLDELLRSSDVITVNIPLIKQTHHLISEENIKKMKDQAILVNVSRGEIIDTKALVKNIKKFRYICLDVLEGEDKYDINDPVIRKLVNSENVCLTPHIAFFTDMTTEEIAKISYANIENFINGKTENRLV